MNLNYRPVPSCLNIRTLLQNLSEYEVERKRIEKEQQDMLKKIQNIQTKIKEELEICFQQEDTKN